MAKAKVDVVEAAKLQKPVKHGGAPEVVVAHAHGAHAHGAVASAPAQEAPVPAAPAPASAPVVQAAPAQAQAPVQIVASAQGACWKVLEEAKKVSIRGNIVRFPAGMIVAESSYGPGIGELLKDAGVKVEKLS